MNIFYLDKDPEKCAQYHCDKHVIKMVLETAQILSTVHARYETSVYMQDKCYSPTHKHHPSVLWAGSASSHYEWLFELFECLSHEYRHRYGREHKSWTTLHKYLRYPPKNMPVCDFTDPPLCMDTVCKIEGNAVESYRNYYFDMKGYIAEYTNRETPSWFTERKRNYLKLVK